MELSKQVSSLAPSQRLKELGVPQQSLFHWTRTHTWKSGEFKPDSEPFIQYRKKQQKLSDYECSAFTTAELGELLPENTKITKGHTYSQPHILRWFYVEEDEHGSIQKWCDTEADARAQLLCYLLEQGLITLK
jgi:hypothetical protein